MVEPIFRTIESGCDNLGLMRGETAPLKRFLFGAVGTTGLLWLAKPEAMFGPDGEPRPWSLISDDPSATNLPVYVPPVITGFVLSTFI